MRLFLSSQDFGDYPEALLQMMGGNKRALFVANAGDHQSTQERGERVSEKLLEFKNQGIDAEELDLRRYSNKVEELKAIVAECDLVWCGGGNTFLLNRALHDSGLDNIIKESLANDRIVYGGSSAGSIVATPSLQGTEWGDDPGQVQIVYKKPIIWEAMNLVSFYFVPHYGSDWFGKEADAMVAHLKKHKLPYKALEDGQVILVNGTRTEFLK